MDDFSLLNCVRSLENKDRAARGKEVLTRLLSLGITPEIQECHCLRITNYIVDFSSGANKKYLLFSGHYDAVKNSPGANDNASSVAVLLGLCRECKDLQIPVKIVFFDREEAWLRTPVGRLGLLGSLYYTFKNDLSLIEAVYNLEFCGLGDSLVIWPVKDKNANISAIKIAEKAAANLDMKTKSAYVPGLLLSSDHLFFRFRGKTNSVTLSLLPEEQLPMIETFISGLSIPGLLSGKRHPMPGVLSSIHKHNDDSSQLKEDSLKLMLSLVLQIINNYSL